MATKKTGPEGPAIIEELKPAVEDAEPVAPADSGGTTPVVLRQVAEEPSSRKNKWPVGKWGYRK